MLEWVWRRAPLAAEGRSETVDTIVLLPPDTGQPRVLTGTAATLWALVNGSRSQSEIISQLSEGLTAVRVDEFLASLRSEWLIEQVTEGCAGEREEAGEAL